MNKLQTLTAASAALWMNPSSFNLSLFSGPIKYRQGPCQVCGQKNVKSGRERGVYLCFRCEVAVELVKRGVEAS